MKIEVGQYTLYSDSMSMWITEKVEKKKGKNAGELEERRVAGYSTSLKNLLESFRRTKVDGCEAESLEELLEALRGAYEDMVAINDAAVKADFRRIARMSE